MIQFNLLPDVKLQYIKAERVKRLVMVGCASVTAFTMAVAILLFVTVNIIQAQQIKSLTSSIKKNSTTLENSKDLDKILTIQNQLNSLPALQAKKPVTSRLLIYLKQLTPAKISIAKLSMDTTAHTMTISGAGDSIATINTFADTLKFTQYTTKTNTTKTKVFSNVVLNSFGRDDKGASFEITLGYDEAIFNIANDVTLDVPRTITTRSATELPDALFQPLSDTSKGGATSGSR